MGYGERGMGKEDYEREGHCKGSRRLGKGGV